ncbi:MAG: T9SS type A sorting domain-containing protein [Edaphocola sp.]
MEQFSAPRPRTARAVLLSFALLAFGGRAARAQSFEAAVYPDNTYPTVLSDTPITNTSAHSVVHCTDSIRAYTWDDDEMLTGFSGLAVTITDNTGSTVETNVTFADKASLEVAIITPKGCAGGNGPVYLLLTYYNPGNMGFEYDVYQLDVSTLSLSPIVTNVSIGPAGIASGVSFGRVRNDALPQENKVAVIWETDNNIYVSTFSIFTLGFTHPIQLLPDTVTGSFSQPDVALLRNEEGTWVYPVFTTAGKDSLFVLRLDYAALSSASSPLSAQVLDGQTTNGTYQLPRIDALDTFPGTGSAWSYVVMKAVDTNQYIYSGLYDGSNLQHYTLNDGTMLGVASPSSPVDISGTSGGIQFNLKPVVALDNWFAVPYKPVYYGWYFKSGSSGTVANLSTQNNDAYIGLKLIAPGEIHPDWNIKHYYVIPDVPDFISDLHSLSFSGYNHTEHLFAAFTGRDTTSGDYNMKYKAVNGSSTAFRPGSSTGVGSLYNNGLDATLYPNPFANKISIAAANGQYTLQVSDLTGRVLARTEGNVAQLNETLAMQSPGWPTGIYLADLKAADGQRAYFKIVKAANP